MCLVFCLCLIFDSPGFCLQLFTQQMANPRITRKSRCALNSLDPERLQQTCLKFYTINDTNHTNLPVSTWYWYWEQIWEQKCTKSSCLRLFWSLSWQKCYISSSHLSLFFFRGVFQSLVTKHFPSEKQRREKGPGNKRKRMSTIFSVTYQKQILEKRLWTHSYLNVLFLDCICLLFSWPSFICCFQTGKPKGRQPKVPKHTVDSGGVINITDDSSSDSEGMDTDSNSSPDSLLDNDDVIFVNHTSCHTGR